MALEEETWKPINDFYDVSNHGRVRSWWSGNWKKPKRADEPSVIKPLTRPNGYNYVVISGKKILIHRLVTEAFIPNPEDKPCVNHIDGIKTNNSACNLEWCTYSENHKHAFKIGLVSTRGNNSRVRKISYSDAEGIRERYENEDISQWELGEEYGIDQSHVSDIVNYKKWRSKC